MNLRSLVVKSGAQYLFVVGELQNRVLRLEQATEHNSAKCVARNRPEFCHDM